MVMEMEQFIKDYIGDIRSLLASSHSLGDRFLTHFHDSRYGYSSRQWFTEYVEKSTDGRYTVDTDFGDVFDDCGMCEGKDWRWIIKRVKLLDIKQMKVLVENLKNEESVKGEVINTDTNNSIPFKITKDGKWWLISTEARQSATYFRGKTQGDPIPKWILGAIMKGESEKVRFVVK